MWLHDPISISPLTLFFLLSSAGLFGILIGLFGERISGSLNKKKYHDKESGNGLHVAPHPDSGVRLIRLAGVYVPNRDGKAPVAALLRYTKEKPLLGVEFKFIFIDESADALVAGEFDKIEKYVVYRYHEADPVDRETFADPFEIQLSVRAGRIEKISGPIHVK